MHPKPDKGNEGANGRDNDAEVFFDAMVRLMGEEKLIEFIRWLSDVNQVKKRNSRSKSGSPSERE
jgi:hypothetical protein